MTIVAVILFALLFLKHYWFDFHWQYPAMLVGKGIYGNPDGVLHSLCHAILTFIILLPLAFALNAPLILWLAIADGVLHYHIDYVKAHYGPKDPSKTIFWKWIGLDQLAHYLVYLGIVALALL